MTWQVGLYATAVLIPLAAFAVEAIFIRQLKRLNAYIATGAIAFSCLLSLFGFLAYAFESNGFHNPEHEAAAEHTAGEHAATAEHGDATAGASHHERVVWSGRFDWVVLGGRAVPPSAARQRLVPIWSCLWESPSTA